MLAPGDSTLGSTVGLLCSLPELLWAPLGLNRASPLATTWPGLAAR